MRWTDVMHLPGAHVAWRGVGPAIPHAEQSTPQQYPGLAHLDLHHELCRLGPLHPAKRAQGVIPHSQQQALPVTLRSPRPHQDDAPAARLWSAKRAPW